MQKTVLVLFAFVFLLALVLQVENVILAEFDSIFSASAFPFAIVAITLIIRRAWYSWFVIAGLSAIVIMYAPNSINLLLYGGPKPYPTWVVGELMGTAAILAVGVFAVVVWGVTRVARWMVKGRGPAES